MLALIAFAWFALAFILGGSQAHTSAWFTPAQSMYLGLAFLALHVCGFVNNRKP